VQEAAQSWARMKTWILVAAVCICASFIAGIYAGHEDRLSNLEKDILSHSDVRKVGSSICITYIARSKRLAFDYNVDNGEVSFWDSEMAKEDELISFPLTKDFIEKAMEITGAVSVADLVKDILKKEPKETETAAKNFLLVAVSTATGFALGFESGKRIETGDERNRIREFFEDPSRLAKLKRDFFVGSFLARLEKWEALRDKQEKDTVSKAVSAVEHHAEDPEIPKKIQAMESSHDAAVHAYMKVNANMKIPGFVPTGKDFELLLTMMNQV
jgi:hypothetical protein